MILNSLAEVARTDPELRPMRCKDVVIAACLLLGEDGTFNGFQPVVKGKAEWGPFIEPTNSGKPGLGIHKIEHLLGFKFPEPTSDKEGIQEKKCKEKSQTTLAFFKKCQDRLDSPALGALRTFMDSLDDATALARVKKKLEQLKAEKKEQEKQRQKKQGKRGQPSQPFSSSQYVAVLVNDKPWFQENSVTDFWSRDGFDLSDGWPEEFTKRKRQKNNEKKGQRDEPSPLNTGEKEVVARKEIVAGQCLVCGTCSPLSRLVGSLDGFGKDKPKLISFNKAAYASRGATQTYNAPICESCADLVPKGWNALIGEPASRKYIGKHRYVFWGDIPLKPWERNDPKQWLDFINSPWGRQPKSVSPKCFHLLGLGSHKSTAYVVAWLEKDQNDVAQAVMRWGKCQNLLGARQRQFFGIADLVRALRPRKEKYGKNSAGDQDFDKLELSFCAALFRASLGEHESLSTFLPRLANRLATEPEDLGGALDRGALDRLVFINLCLHSLNGKEEPSMEELSQDNRNAFNCGRIFNLITWAQSEAVGKDTGKTILGANARLASSRPRAILGQLITRLQSIYLPKLRRDDRGLAVTIDRQLSDLLRETEFPRNNSSEQMGWFWKGFYHRAIESVRTGKEEMK